MTWMWLVAAASAQTAGIEDDPNYESYMRAIEALGGSNPPPGLTPQILPGTIAFVDPLGAAPGTGGSLASINTPLAPPHYSEALVLYDKSSMAAINARGFVLGFEGIIDNNQAAMDDHLEELHDEDIANPSVAYWAASMGVTNKAPPTPQQIAALPVLDASSPYYDLYSFTLEQNGVLVGWLMRERFISGDNSESFRDFWYFRSNYVPVGNGVGDVTAERLPHPAPTNAQQFLNGIPLSQVNHFQLTTTYKVEGLGSLVP